MIERIYAPPSVDDSELLAIIIHRTGWDKHDGIHFISSPDDQHQIGLMKHPKDHVIEPHLHIRKDRWLSGTPETLVILSGLMQADFYTSECRFVCSRQVGQGGVVVLLAGGHGFRMLEDCEAVECKQGPYCGPDKVRFIPRRDTIKIAVVE